MGFICAEERSGEEGKRKCLVEHPAGLVQETVHQDTF